MPRSFSLFSRKKPSRHLKDFYAEWSKTLTDHLLPLLRHSLASASSASVISSIVNLLLRHLVSYYETLDLAADPNTIPYLLFPSWRNSLETPFLFLGDIHPYLFTNLIRSFIDRENNDSMSSETDCGLDLNLDWIGEKSEEKPWKIATAWKDPSDELVTQIHQIECAMRLMVPVLVDRMKRVQGMFVGRVAEDWVSSSSSQDRTKKRNTAAAATATATAAMEEMVSIFVDANRLRKSVITDIVAATSEHQAALFLEGLSQFLVGFKDQILLDDFEFCALPR